MALPATQDLSRTPTPIAGLTVGTVYQVQLRTANSALIETATSPPSVDSKRANYLGNGDWARVRRDGSGEQIYIWNTTGRGYVVINEGLSNA